MLFRSEHPDETKITPRKSVQRATREFAEGITQKVDNLYSSAVSLWQENRLREAAAQVEEALLLDDSLPTLHYLKACCDLELSNFRVAAEGFARCMAQLPDYPLSAQARIRQALCNARLNPKIDAPISKAPPGKFANTSIAVIVCSQSRERLNKVRQQYDHHLAGVQHEFIEITDAQSLAEGYTRAIAQEIGRAHV